MQNDYVNVTFFVGIHVFTWNLYFKIFVTENVEEKAKQSHAASRRKQRFPLE